MNHWGRGNPGTSAGWLVYSTSSRLPRLSETPEHPGMRITVAVHAGETIKPKTLQSILKQAGLSVAEFQELL